MPAPLMNELNEVALEVDAASANISAGTLATLEASTPQDIFTRFICEIWPIVRGALKAAKLLTGPINDRKIDVIIEKGDELCHQ